MSLLVELRGRHVQQALELLGWTGGMLADAAHLSTSEIAKLLDDRAPMLNVVINCIRALEAAGIRFESGPEGVRVRAAP
ncbi:hypothetical protein Hoch_0407 [Haliangium ochraceum DSM 14365]|uniref:Uncharacterized protein n=1 Tax=Haliangium ochraceum (strain DSM 14365 / JCM 11303 / SMP-2) TaxID=502025 RepID=D0LJ19_HALO1|nr:hypothetical protein Hoch_0407 [Haliangium ochraceum DSM 14365]